MVLSKDPIVWLDGARPAKTCIPPSFLRNMPMQTHSVPAPKNTFASTNKFAKFGEITFICINQRKRLTKSFLVTSKNANCTSPINFVFMKHFFYLI